MRDKLFGALLIIIGIIICVVGDYVLHKVLGYDPDSMNIPTVIVGGVGGTLMGIGLLYILFNAMRR